MNKNLSVLKATLLAIIVTGLLAFPVSALVTYSAPYTVTENASNSYDMLGVIELAPNEWLADNGYMNASANDTRIETLGGLEKPHLVTDNMTLTAIPVPADSQTNLYFTTGSSAQDMYVITGEGGYITTSDDDTYLEPGANFTIEQKGWVDTDSGSSKNLVYKESAFATFIDGSENITSAIYATGVQDSYDGSDDVETNMWQNTWYAQTFTPPNDFVIQSVEVFAKRAGTPGTVTALIRPTSAGLPTGTGTEMTTGTTDGNAWTTAMDWRNISISDYSLTGSVQYALVIKIVGAGGDDIYWGRDNTAPTYAGGDVCRSVNSGGTWSLLGTPNSDDFDFRVNGMGVAASVTATGTSSGECIVTTTANTTHMWIDIDGSTEDTVALSGASVPDNSNDWTFLQNDVMPYMEYLTMSIGGTDQLWYQPASMLDGATLPDREGVAQNGVITWGENPAGVGVVLGSLVSEDQPTPGIDGDEPAQDILPPVEVTDWFIDPDVSGTLLTNPLRPFVTLISDNTTLSEIQSWRLLGLVFVLLVTVATAKSVGRHQGITMIVAGCGIGLNVALTIFPMWTLVFAIGMFIGGLVMERSPSL